MTSSRICKVVVIQLLTGTTTDETVKGYVSSVKQYCTGFASQVLQGYKEICAEIINKHKHLLQKSMERFRKRGHYPSAAKIFSDLSRQLQCAASLTSNQCHLLTIVTDQTALS